MHQLRKNQTGSTYYMYGKHAVMSAIKNPLRKIKKIYCLTKSAEELRKLIPNNILIDIVSNEFITSKIGKNQTHQGVITQVNSIFQLESKKLEFDQESKIAIIDQVTDPQNIGSIIRSGVAFGITTFIVPNDNTPDENAVIAKAACGCLEFARIIRVTNLKRFITKLKNQGFWIAGLDARGQDNFQQLNNIERLAVIIGSEGKGMRELTSKSCDFLVKIPISPKIDSLNASVAASIIFHHISTI